MTNLDQSGGSDRLAPRPVSRPPVDPAERRAFGRPEGVDGSFVGAGPLPRSGRVHTDGPGARPGAGRGVRPAVRSTATPCSATPPTPARWTPNARRTPEEPADPWRDPGAAAALGTPALPQTCSRADRPRRWASSACATCCSAARSPTSRWRSLSVLALVIGFAGGWVGRKTAEVVEAFTTSKVTLETNNNSEEPHRPVRQGRGVGGRFGGDGRGGQRCRGLAGLRRDRRRARLHRHQQPRHLRGRRQPQPVQDARWCSTTARRCRPTSSAVIPRPTSRCSRSTTSTT